MKSFTSRSNRNTFQHLDDMRIPFIMTMKVLIALVFLAQVTFSSAQPTRPPYIERDHPVYRLEVQMMNGEKLALLKIAPYFDSARKVSEPISNHTSFTNVAHIARRIVKENCFFLDDSEFEVTDSTTGKQFADFLNSNYEKIAFSSLASCFLITGLEDRSVNYELRAMSEDRKHDLKSQAEELLATDWVKDNGIDVLIAKKDSKALLSIAAALFRNRDRYNRYCFDRKEYIDLLKYLTGVAIGVENEDHEMSWRIESEYHPYSELNLLIYFAKYYEQYSWDEQKAVFVNPRQLVKPLEEERQLFELLGSKNDSLAFGAFTKLTLCDKEKVTQLADEYPYLELNRNYAIPTFPFSFLKQLVLLVDYCHQHNIDFMGSKELQTKLGPQKGDLPFAEKRKIEEWLISSLSPNEITALEYWSIICENRRQCFSAGRVLDKFYSGNWDKIIADDKLLECYLKKSILFDRLGIIGTCNDYLKKFTNSSPATLSRLAAYHSADTEVNQQIVRILQMNKDTSLTGSKQTMYWDSRQGSEIENVSEQIERLEHNVVDSSKTDDTICKILSQINYQQIPEALAAIQDYPFKSSWKKYSFMKSDWGLYEFGDFDKKAVRDSFLKVFMTHSEYGLYAYYLDHLGIDYKAWTGLPDYDKVYDILKYDVAVDFVGGSGGPEDNEVYAVVKLLELTFHTTLGFPKKLCESNNMYSCTSESRAVAWIRYLSEKNLLRQKHDEPVSFHYTRW